MRHEGKAVRLGSFTTKEEAEAACDAVKLNRVALADPVFAPLPRLPRSEGVYFIRHTRSPNLIKIGHSVDMAKRASSLAVATPHTTELLAYIEGPLAIESGLHSYFAKQRVRGEWFRLRGDLLSLVKVLNHVCSMR